jgi:RimJ/RimL family protein N-acetyltransferase
MRKPSRGYHATMRPRFALPDLPIRTQRLMLRPFEETDLDDVYAYQSRPDVVRYLYWEVRDRDGAAEALRAKVAASCLTREGDRLTLAIVLPDEAAVIGEVLLKWISDQHRQGEVGFVLNPDHHGHGYATEAAREMLRLGFEVFGLHRIAGHCDARNDASASVMRRLGMRLEAHFVQNEIFKGEWGDELVFAMLAAEWERLARESVGSVGADASQPRSAASAGGSDSTVISVANGESPTRGSRKMTRSA